jgi:osomolarity two-component system response regulator SSK1
MSAKAATPPLDRIASPRPPKADARDRRGSVGRPAPDAGGRRASDKQPTYSFLEGIVPPINVLIVEDNPINLRLLEMFAKRLKVRWSTAMNGRDAVIKWRAGGFHLVLMDIQLPIMSGLEATKEIRRLERVNGIGVFARSEGEERVGMAKVKSIEGGDGLNMVQTESTTGAPVGDDKLDGIFKSPVIIVALTASSLQSDRHEALAAGCNDFLTKVCCVLELKLSLALTYRSACFLRMAREKGHGMGMHASID